MSDKNNPTPGTAPASGSPRQGGFPGHGPGFGPGRGPGPMMQVEKAKNGKAALGRLLALLKGHELLLGAVLVLVVLATLASLASSYLMRPVLNGFADAAAAALSGAPAGARVEAGLQAAFTGILLMAGAGLLGALLSWAHARIMLRVSLQMTGNLRQQLFDHLQDLPVRYFDTHPAGDLMSRLTNDLEGISQTVSSAVSQLVSSVFLLTGTLILMVWINPILTLVTLASLPVITLTTRFITKRVRRFFKGQQETLGAMNGFAEETISGQEMVLLLGGQDRARAEFGRLNAACRTQAVKAQFFSRMVGPVNNTFNNMNYALTATAGAWLALTQGFDLGGVATFLGYSQQFSRPVNELSNLVNSIMSALAGAERIFAVLDEKSEYRDDSSLPCPRHQGSVRFDHVDFSYEPDSPVLRDLCLEARAGTMTALVGPTGAGKTTIVNLLTRFFDIDGGTIHLDGTDIRSYARDSLRRRTGLVLQDTWLFAGTIRDNIRLGRLDATEEEVREAARRSRADTFIHHLSAGYDTLLTEGAGNLSQGQRQLLTIARALLADPDILILDEATSSVDTRTEVHIQHALRELMKGRTSFVIAHRLSTIREADLIAVLDQGHIVESGTHRELVARDGLYARLTRIQEEGREI